MNESTIDRAREVRAMVEEYYEPGRQDRSKSWIWRNVVRKRIRIGYSTFWAYLRIAEDQE